MNDKRFELFGHYMFLKKVADGGMAEVFLARPSNPDGNGRVQIVKRILPHIASHPSFLKMFQREIQIIMGFNHANVVQLHDFGQSSGRLFIVMEYIEGKNLRDIVEKLKTKNLKTPVAMVLSMMAQAASGLHYAHTFINNVSGEPLDVVHRDISPHNLIVSYEGNLKVIDFGIAKAATSVQDMTQTGTVKGKAAYFAPEQVTGQTVDARTDIFALGTVAWELLTGERLFAKHGDTEITAMGRVNNCEKHVVAPSTINKKVPFDVDRVILKALEKNPNERYRDAREFQKALRETLIMHFPAYTYAETGRLVSAIFSEELDKERAQIRELNALAQNVLIGSTEEGKTVSMVGDGASIAAMHTGVFNQQPRSEHVVDFRLSKIEAMLKQKASGRHYLMLAIYIISLFALKFIENYDLSIDVSKVVEVVPPAEAATPGLPQQLIPATQQVQYTPTQKAVQNQKTAPSRVQSQRSTTTPKVTQTQQRKIQARNTPARKPTAATRTPTKAKKTQQPRR